VLRDEIFSEIALAGPMSVSRYMQLCLQHPKFGYYKTRDPLGRDFTTSPEISQIFGEMIGVWIASLGMAHIKLCEAGPGRGTLMADILRVLAKAGITADVHLVEINPILKAEQAKRVQATYHETIPDCDVLIANEFVDCLPINQYREGHEVRLGADFQFALSPFLLAPSLIKHSTFTEICDYSGLNHNFKHALFIDYGYINGAGDTLQAMKNGQYVNVLETPGEADLTAHVDFTALQKHFGRGQISTQRDFLLRHGFMQRMNALKPHGAERLIDVSTPQSMGCLFKVLEI
jgi:NADH dehydrogenase [ubiquinone] 1 alpha subcomplex assembly factor 7